MWWFNNLSYTVLPQSLQVNIDEAIVNQSFNATCLSTGYPAPKVYITLDCQPDTLTSNSFQIDHYTMKEVISVNKFPASCSTIYCYSYPINCTESINHTIVINTGMEPTTSTTIVPTKRSTGATIKATKMIMLIIPTLLIITY